MSSQLHEQLAEKTEIYLQYLRVERRLSAVTITNYRRQLATVIQMLVEMKIDDWAKMDTPIVRNIAAKSRRAGLQSASMALRLSALRSFCDWMVQQGELTANPVKRYGLQKQKNRYRKIWMLMKSLSYSILIKAIPYRLEIARCWKLCMVRDSVSLNWLV